MASWKDYSPRELKKIVYALDVTTLKKTLKNHLDRGWIVASEIKEHRNGVGVLVKYPNKWEED